MYSLSARDWWQDWQRAVFSLVLIERSGQNHWNCQSPVRRRGSKSAPQPSPFCMTK